MLLLLGSLLAQAQPGGAAPQWFDKDTLFTAAGATAAVIAVTSVLQRLWAKLPARWFALVFSLALTLLAISVRQQGWTGINIFLALVNGLMTYAAAVGVNTVVTAPPGGAAPPTAQAGVRSYRWWH